jgi:NADPH:quinone reductase-like Zn-dependent oxidoreductase
MTRAGLTVITTASPSNFDFVKSRGADAVFDYHDPDCGDKIREHTQGRLHRVFDTIALPETAAICANALAPHPNEGETLRYTSSLPVENFPRDDVVTDTFLAYTVTGEVFEKWDMPFPAIPTLYGLATRFWQMTARLLEEGKLVPHPVEKRDGGLGGIVDG